MRIWIPRLILLAFALLLAYAVYWGYKNTQKPVNTGNSAPSDVKSHTPPPSSYLPG